MVRKVYLAGRYGTREESAGLAWARLHAESMDAWARSLDSTLWEESVAFAHRMRVGSRARLDVLERAGIQLGGGGCYELLYFLTRLHRPSTVLETGVAAGWSTLAILSAIDKNGHGFLHSSEFPYVRLANPESYVAYLVPEELRRGPWRLYLKGDRRNLDAILTDDVRLDLVHYDSDKRRGGRDFFVRRIKDHMAPDAIMVFDDANQDLFFRDFVEGSGFRVFAHGDKFVGVTGASV